MNIEKAITDSISVKQKILQDVSIHAQIWKAAEYCIETYRDLGGKVLFCGNGGSAADAQHLAAELSGRYLYDRDPLYSEALHVNTSYLTAVANDYSYDLIYSRMIKGSGKKGDVLFGISTSGNSVNVINALKQAKELGMKTVAFTGAGGGEMASVADLSIRVPSEDTPRIQEAHIMIGHIICEIIESELFPRS
ncbi:MAG: phosphoheptose isomerase [Bacteroidetes bacterium]|nr:MAG: phosphoheptose isomerase [Bacteroidota bacterium]